jgi:putative ABC transport system ATP-binding protein
MEKTMNKETDALISFQGISKVYGSGEAKTYALRGIDLKIYEGEFVAIMGSSGSGKSTAMNIIGCLDEPTDGEYFFQGVDVKSLSLNQKALLRRNYMGFVFQGFNLLGKTSALENVELPLIYRGSNAKSRKIESLAALDKVGIKKVSHHYPSQLSGGQQQRVAIARALVTNPLLMLADEPTGNLDSQNSKEVMQLLQNLNKEQNITIIMVTHEDDMASYADRTIVFKDGLIISDGRET